jgi:hypothetical protein
MVSSEVIGGFAAIDAALLAQAVCALHEYHQRHERAHHRDPRP